MSGYEIVLSLHILAAVLGFFVAGVAHSTMYRLSRADDMAKVRDHLKVLDKVGPFFGVSALLLLAFGAYLVQIAPSDADISWSDGWILAALIGLVVVEAVGGAVIGRAVKALAARMEDAPDGPVTADTRILLADKAVWVASHATTATMAAIVFVMVGKPSGMTSVVILVIGAVVGALSALPFLKPVKA